MALPPLAGPRLLEHQLIAVATRVGGGSGAAGGAGAHHKLALHTGAILADRIDLARVDAAYAFDAVADIATRTAPQRQGQPARFRHDLRRKGRPRALALGAIGQLESQRTRGLLGRLSLGVDHRGRCFGSKRPRRRIKLHIRARSAGGQGQQSSQTKGAQEHGLPFGANAGKAGPRAIPAPAGGPWYQKPRRMRKARRPIRSPLSRRLATSRQRPPAAGGFQRQLAYGTRTLSCCWHYGKGFGDWLARHAHSIG